MPTADLALLLPSWELALRAERKSPQTVKVYGDGVRRFLAWCAAEDRVPVLDRPTVAAFVTTLLDTGAEPATARTRQLALRRFSAWLVEEGEAVRDELAGTRPPRLDVKVVDPLTDDQLRALVAACAGPDMRDRRDEALVRLMAETGARAGEVVAMTRPDVDLRAGTAVVRRGKGGKGRVVPFGPQTVRAVDRYLRARRTHRLADSDVLWLGDRGKAFTYDALHKTLRMRAERAGVAGFHPHRLRHTAAHRWLAAGGSEGGLMAVAGWTRPDMLLRLHPRPGRGTRRGRGPPAQPGGPVRRRCSAFRGVQLRPTSACRTASPRCNPGVCGQPSETRRSAALEHRH